MTGVGLLRMTMTVPDADITWLPCLSDEDELLERTGVLYAYVRPARPREILYIGKADRTSVWQRLNDPSKEIVFEKIGTWQPQVLVGNIALQPGRRLSSEMLSDIESLLIFEVQPFGNTQSKQTRIRRPGLTVTCNGDWPHWQRLFVDR